MPFIPRSLPRLIMVGDHTVHGPFCESCGNPQFVHRPSDKACPKRRLSVFYPRGQRERECTCGTTGTATRYNERCAVFVHHPNGRGT